MDYNIRHITNKAKLQTKAFRPQYLTIHSTANTASAQNERGTTSTDQRISRRLAFMWLWTISKL